MVLLHSETPHAHIICGFHGGFEIVHVFKLLSYCPRNQVYELVGVGLESGQMYLHMCMYVCTCVYASVRCMNLTLRSAIIVVVMAIFDLLNLTLWLI